MHAQCQALASTKAGAKEPAKKLPLPWKAEDWALLHGPKPRIAPAQLVPALPVGPSHGLRQHSWCQPSGMHIAPIGLIPQQHYAPAFRAYVGTVPTVHFEL